jgi:hypothetical protein
MRRLKERDRDTGNQQMEWRILSRPNCVWSSDRYGSKADKEHECQAKSRQAEDPSGSCAARSAFSLFVMAFLF